MSNAVVKINGGQAMLPTVLGQGPARIPTGGKIRAGIKVLTAKAAAHPDARAIYERGMVAGDSFVQIEQALATALPQLKSPLVPKNVSWFTVRGQDFSNPEIARQILEAHGDDRGDGVKRLYRFPVVFPSDLWQVVMPHELAAWGAAEKHYWSEYSPDGRVRYCKQHASVPFDDTGKRVIRLFGGRKAMLREQNGGLCDPESCREYQRRQCNLTGRFLFFIPGIRSISAFELHTNSFYAMNMAIQKFETISFLRGGRISGFLDSQRTPFYLTKKLMEVARIDEQGRAVRVPQWIIDLEAPVDVTALIRHNEDEGAAIVQAQRAAHVLDDTLGLRDGLDTDNQLPSSTESAGNQRQSQSESEVGWRDIVTKGPTLEQIADKVQSYGIDLAQFDAYADQRWGSGWRFNAFGRQHAHEELERYRNDPKGYLDKIDCAMRGRT